MKQISFANVPNPVVVPVTASTSSRSSIGINRVTSTCNLVFPVIKSGIIKVGKWFSGLSRKAKTVLGTSVGVFVLFCMLISAVNHIIIPNAKYNSAMQMLENEQYSDAYNAFIGLGSHEDSTAMAATAKQLETNSLHYSKALSLLDENSKEEAISEFEQANGYKDSNEQIAAITESINREKYEEAENLLSDEKFDEAITAFSQIKDYSDSKEQIAQIKEMKLESRYNEAGAFRESGEYDKAVKIYEELDAYKDSSDLYLESMYDYAVSHKIATDNRTQKYLIELKKIGYEDAQYIYDSLFYYYVEIIMNNDPDDVTTDMPVIAWRDKDSKIYGHVKLCFTGEYDMLNDEGIILKYQFDIYSFTNAQSGEWEFKFTQGQTGWAFPGINSYGSGVGASRFRVFDEKGNILGSKTFEITRIN